jgi:hypothetical protein
MSGANGNRKPPRPRIEIVHPKSHPGGSGRIRASSDHRSPSAHWEQPAGSDSEAAAIVAALEQFLADTAPPPVDPGPTQSAWQRAALEEGISARQVRGPAWGHAPSMRP